MPLSPSQRILLMKEITARLSSEEWPLIDVTLKQFSLPWSDEWRGTKDAYVLHMVEDAADQPLIDLAQHVGFQFEEAAAPRVDPPFWRKGMLSINRVINRVVVTFLPCQVIVCAGLTRAALRRRPSTVRALAQRGSPRV